MNKGLLPIGTVVLLKDATKKLMITGYYSKSDESEKVYQYNSCIFPEGFIDNTFCLFDHNQIDEVCYMGLKSDEFDDYISNYENSTQVSTVKTNEDSHVKVINGREYGVRNIPTAKHPRSISEMRARFAVDKISGGQDTKIGR